MERFERMFVGSVVAAWIWSCGDDPGPDGGAGTTAGEVPGGSTGGTLASTGGAGSGAGNALGIGGESAMGGVGSPGASGGATSSGGSTASGGSVVSGGSAPIGGTSSTGGSTAAGAAPSGGTSSTGGDSGVWRPYSDLSPWNTPIGANPSIDPDSESLIADFESSSEYGEHLDVNIEGFSIPLFWADASTPRVSITCEVGGHGFVGDNGMSATAEIPMPSGAVPDPESDHHLLIIDTGTNTEYGLWNAQDSGGTWTCGLGALQDLNGDGVRPLAAVADPWWEAHGPRACGYGLVAGLIRPEEVEAGVIEHALVIAYPHVRSGFYVSPASTAQASNGAGAEPDRGIPCGGRIQYDPSIDVSTLEGVTPAGQVILRALQTYGAFIGDYSGAISLYADNSPEARAYWSSIAFDSYELMDIIDLADFRVLTIGPMNDNGNG